MFIIFETNGTLTPSQSKQHIVFPFQIATPIHGLMVDFEYSPKYLDDEQKAKDILIKSLPRYYKPEPQDLYKQIENYQDYLPLKNLLTVSIDDPFGFRGAAHRQPPQQTLFITEHKASPGFFPGPLAAGQWNITLSIHAVVTEECTYLIRVWEGE